MSKEKRTTIRAKRTDWKNTKQSDESRNGPIEKEQKPGGLAC
jgi:hypothetical protein